MTTKVDIGSTFKANLKRLGRKYPSVVNEVNRLIAHLENDERPGDKVPNIGYDVYKVRLKNPSAQKGKSGGFRAIYYVRIAEHTILLTIYSKSQQEDVNPELIRRLIQDYTS